MEKLTCTAYAKLNLTLDITGRRNDGYHLMDMLMTTVSLFDLVTVEKRESTISVTCSDPTLPTDSRNIVYKAAAAFFEVTGISGGCHIDVEKHIPVQAGMGGGSSDGAAVIMALNLLYHTKLTKPQMCDIGVRVGADIPFIIMGGAARVRGIGDLITPLSDLPKCAFVTAMPQIGISTKEAFEAFDSLTDPVRPATDLAQRGIDTNDYNLLAFNLCNAMGRALNPGEVNALKEKLLAAGADASCMTGSGAAVFGIFKTVDDAKKAAELLNSQNIWAEVCTPTDEGVVIFSE